MALCSTVIAIVLCAAVIVLLRQLGSSECDIYCGPSWVLDALPAAVIAAVVTWTVGFVCGAVAVAITRLRSVVGWISVGLSFAAPVALLISLVRSGAAALL